jgi:type I restriction enzyme, S subunit
MNNFNSNDWRIVQFKNILFERKERELNNGKFPLYSLTIKDGVSAKSDRYEREFLVKNKDKKTYKIVETNDLVFNPSNLRWGAIARSKNPFPVLVSPLYEVLYSLNKSELDPIFLGYLSQSDEMHLQYVHFMEGTLIERTALKIDDFLKLHIKLPPILEQKKIASILSCIDMFIDKLKKHLEKLNNLKKANINDFLTKGVNHNEFKDSELGKIPVNWKVYKLDELLELKNGINTDKDAFGSGFPFISYMDVNSGNELNETTLTKFVNLNSKEHKAFSVKFGDILFTRTSETPEEIGLSNTYLGKNVGAVFNGFCIRGRPKTKLLSAKLSKYLFRSEYIRTQMKFLCKYTTRAGISGESLKRCLVAIPPLNEQSLFESVLINIDKNIKIRENKIQQTQFLKKSLMQVLLTGKVRVKVN